MNKCLYTYLTICSNREKLKNKIIEEKKTIENQIIWDKPLPFINGKLAPAEYFYNLFTIKELKSENFKPKIFLVIDKKLDGKTIKIGELTIVELKYIEVK